MRKAIALSLAACLSLTSLGAQEPARPDFSGEWVLDATASVRADMPPRGTGPAPVARPRQTKDVRPKYPPIAQQARITGTVILQAVVDALGHVTELRILRGVPALDDAAAEAVSQWEYEPTRVDGVAVAVNVTVTVSFNLTRTGGPPASGAGPGRARGPAPAPPPPIAIKQDENGLKITRRISGGSETITYRFESTQATNKLTLTSPRRGGEYRYTSRWDGERLISDIDSFERDFSVKRTETIALDGDRLSITLERPDLIVNGQPYRRTDIYTRVVR
jgi:TonB family protein